MAWGVRGSATEVFPVWRTGRKRLGHFHLTMAGFLLVGLAGLLCASEASPATSDKANNPDNRGDAKAAVNQAEFKAEETVIYPNDLLFIQVFDVDQMTREYRVGPTGTLVFPLLPEALPVQGLTPQQVADLISKKCIEAGLLSHPQISVTVRESRVHSVAIAGAVRNPQIYPILGRISLLDIISQAGGITEDAGASVTVTRGEVSTRLLASNGGGTAEGGKPQPVPTTVTVDLRDLLETGDPNANIGVYPGDRVTVQRAGVVYVLGAVNRAGAYLLTESRHDMTVLKALALAESLKSTAKGKKAVILRADSSAAGGREEIPVDLHAMLQGHAPDKPLLNNDILFVPDSLALKALHKSADVAVQTAGLAVIYK